MSEVEMIENDIVDMTANPHGENGLLNPTSMDNLEYLANRADKAIDQLNRIMKAALKVTTERDWILIGGTPYLQESGATKVARLFGISWKILETQVSVDNEGYKTFTYRGQFMLNGQFIECEGARSMKDDFFAGKNKKKKPDEIDERDVKLAAYTNCVNNGIKRIIPNLRNLDITDLERAGMDTSKIGGYTFKDGSKGGASKAAEDSGLVCAHCGKAISQKVASYSQSKYGEMLCMDCQSAANAPQG